MEKIKGILIPKKREEAEYNNLIDWNTFFRNNIDEFIDMYFGIKLYDYQKIILHELGNKISSTVPASRATAKSWLASVFGCGYSVLYPNTKAVIASPTKAQSTLIIGTIASLRRQSPNLNREIVKIKENKDDSEVVFKNGSTLIVVPMTEGGRGYRANLIIIEEAASVKKKILDQIVLPFSFQRPAPFRMKKKYKHIKEPTRKLYIGSIKEKTNWFHKHCLQQMLIEGRGDPNGILRANQVTVLTLDYLTSLYHNIKTKEDIMTDRISFDEITWQHEYLNIPSSDSEDAFFKRNLFEKNQHIREPWYPAKAEEYISGKYIKLPREDIELRILAVDIALAMSTKTANNDLTALGCIRARENGAAGISRAMVYLETFSGANTKEQAVRIRQIMEDFDADFLILDCKGVGKGVYDVLTDFLEDPIRGVTYSPIKAMAHDSVSEDVRGDLEARVISPSAEPLIYPFIGTDKTNSSMWFSLKDKLRSGKIQLVISDVDAESMLAKKLQAKWMDDDTDRVWLLRPYKEMARMMSEAIALDQKVSAGYVKLIEKPKARKDRIVCLGMANFYIDFIETEYLQGFSNEDILAFIRKLSAGGTPGGFDPGADIFK